MAAAANPRDDPADLAALRRHADALLAAIEASLGVWVEGCVRARYEAWSGEPTPPELQVAARTAADQAVAEALPTLRVLLETDVDEQRSNPLAILRQVARHPTDALREAGVPPLVRDAHAERLFPADLYDLGPAAFRDLGPAVHERGLEWGAAKAHVVLRRRRTGPR